MKRTDDDAFGRGLREAAAAVTPETSEELHARVMADVRRARAVDSSAPHHGRAARWWMAAAAVAAALAVAVAVWVTTSREPNVAPAPHELAELPPVPSLEAVVVETIQPVREKLYEARFAYLDRDTKRLARFLIRAVPGMPAEARGAAAEEATPSSTSGT